MNRVYSMNQQGWIVTSLFSACALVATSVNAQLPNSNLELVSPAFAKAGSTVNVFVSGQHLEELTGLRFSDTRITGKPATKPTNEVFPKPKPITNKFTVTIPADIKPGIVEVRTLGFFGLSTARPFMILPADAVEIVETGQHHEPETAMPLAIETGVTGIFDNQRMDWYKITAKKGERLMIQIWSERMDSKSNAQIKIVDTNGRELENNREHFVRDPLVDFTAPADGEYFIGVSDFLYKGGAAYFYRLKVSRAPIIDFVWPPAGVPGKKTKFTIYGRNLPNGSPGEGVKLNGKLLESIEVELDVPAVPTICHDFSGTTPRQTTLPGFTHTIAGSNAAKIGFASAPIVFEKPDSKSQTVTIPCEIVGKFNTPGDNDKFRFSAKKDAIFHLEVIADRHVVEADTVLVVRKVGDEKIVAENDDTATFFSINQHDSTNLDTTDAMLSFTADADADYEVTLINQSGGGSAAHFYRLAIRPAQPDFELFTTTERTITATNGRAGYPAAPLVRRRGAVAYRVLAPRQDGFEGEIVVTVVGLPAGVTAPPLKLSGKSTSGFLTIHADENAKKWAGPITISGTAQINGKPVVRVAKNASLVWGTIFSDSLRVRTRLDLETVLSVIGEESTPTFISVADPKPIWEVELRKKLEIPVKITDYDKLRKGNLTVLPYGFPGMLRSPPTLTIAEGKNEGVLTLNFNPTGNFKIEAGDFQFVLQGTGITKYQHNPKFGLAATAEHKRLTALEKTLVTQVTAANKKLVHLKKEKAPGAEITAAQKTITDANARVKKATAARDAADKVAKAARAKAVAKDTKYAVFSAPISVRVKPVPVKTAKVK